VVRASTSYKRLRQAPVGLATWNSRRFLACCSGAGIGYSAAIRMAGLGRINRSIFEHRYRDNKWDEWLAERGFPSSTETIKRLSDSPVLRLLIVGS